VIPTNSLLDEAALRQKSIAVATVYNFQTQFRVLLKGKYTMKNPEDLPCYEQYQRHVKLLKLQGKAKKTVDSYSRAIRRVSEYFDCCPDELTPEQLQNYFSDRVRDHSWSMVKIDRLVFSFTGNTFSKKTGNGLILSNHPK